MVTRLQPGLDRDLDVFKVLARHHGASFGVSTNRPDSWHRARSGDQVMLAD